MDMGTGKTITTIAVAGTLYRKHLITQMLVVCPKSIVESGNRVREVRGLRL